MGMEIWNKLFDDEDTVTSDQVLTLAPVPTPSPGVNWAIGGGIVPGKVYCFDGVESSGKSFFAMECIKELLKTDPTGIVIWFDAEMSFSTHWRDKLIAPDDHKRIIIRRKNKANEIFDYFYDVIGDIVENKGGKVLGCVLDSLQSIVPPREVKAVKTTDVVMGDLSQYLPKAFRRIVGTSRRYGIPWIIISQVRVDMDPNAKYKGRQYITSGGQAFRHFIDVELFFDKIYSKDSKIFGDTKNMNDTAIQVGHTVRAKCWKNRLAKPYRIAEFKLHYDRGIIDTNEEIFSLAASNGIITRKGSNYYFDDLLLGAGKDRAVEMINSAHELQQAILDKVENVVVKEASEDDVIIAENDEELGI